MEVALVLILLIIICAITGAMSAFNEITRCLKIIAQLMVAIHDDNKEETVVYRPWEDPYAKDRKIWVKSRNVPPDYYDPYDK